MSIGDVRWQMILVVAALWFAIYLVTKGGTRSISRVQLPLMVFSTATMLAMFVRMLVAQTRENGVTLGVGHGFLPDNEKLADAAVSV